MMLEYMTGRLLSQGGGLKKLERFIRERKARGRSSERIVDDHFIQGKLTLRLH
jgi:hypothetical protein